MKTRQARNNWGFQIRLRSGVAIVALMAFTLTPDEVRATSAGESGAIASNSTVLLSQADAAHPFDISAGPLGPALIAFGSQSGMQVAVDSAAVTGKSALAIRGTMTAQDALARLLAGSGLAYSFTSANAVSVTAAGEGMVLSPITVEGQTESAYGPVVGYAAARSGTGTKTDTPLMETPASVQVVPKDVIKDQAAVRLADVYENVSGVSQGGTTMNAQSEIIPIIRGFESTTLMVNGMRQSDVGAVDLLGVERVEVLKGPASILYGALEPGGVVNIVTKRPTQTPEYSLEQQVGSYSFYRTEGQATGKVSEDGKLSYRAGIAYTNSGSFRDNQTLERQAYTGSLLWEPTVDTELLFDLSYLYEEQPYDTGVPIGFNGEQLVPDSTSFQDPTLKGREISDYMASLQTRHRFDDVWAVRNQIQFHMTDAKNESVRPRGMAGTVGNELIRLRYQNEDRTEAQIQMTTDITSKFETGSVGHTVLLGNELFYDKSKFDRFRANMANVAVSANPGVSAGATASDAKNDHQTGDTVHGALYLQDQMSMLEDGRLKLLFGGRFDAVKTEFTDDGVSSEDVVDHAMTGRSGALYQVSRNASVYASYSQSFIPPGSAAVDVSGQPLPPETGYQYEAGVKLESTDKDWLATASVFRIKKRNVAVFDTVTSAYLRGIDQQTQGVELDVSGEIYNGLKVIGYYAYTDSEVLRNETDPTTIGDYLGNVPMHKARVWMRYDFAPNTAMKGWGIGGGARYVSENTAQFNSDVKLDPYVVFDAAAWYDWNDNIKLRLNAKNLLNEHYYARASDQSIVHPGEPLTVIGSLSISF